MKLLTIINIILLFVPPVLSQVKIPEKDVKSAYILTGVEDRAAGIHNAGNVGLFFENRGKLYPRRTTEGPSGEYPINSGHHYIYRMNPVVGIPGNVVQARFTINEEWEAVGGYHNAELSQIAFSDNPETWDSQLGWPVKDSSGNPIFISDQDSYCVYSDSANSVLLLDLFIHQTGYVFADDSTEDIIFFNFEVINHSQTEYDSVYFSLYCDVDVGNASGGEPEYADDRIGFDKENHFLYFFDDGFSPDWSDSTTGYFGIIFLNTPVTTISQTGITDFHYNLYDDDVDIDTIQFGIMSSSESLYNSEIGYKYFHPGTQSNIHFDDTSTIPQTGLDVVANISSGPYNLGADKSLYFCTALIGGDNYDDIHQNMLIAKNVLPLILTEVNEKRESYLPGFYKLFQNYPNPFNSSTVIRYSILKDVLVTLEVYNVIGEKVATLVNEIKEAGSHTVEISANNLPSGVYFCQLRAGSYTDTKKMILLK